jgi:hypothetical protein
MASLISQNRPLEAADIATQASSFYNVTLKNFAAPWTNRDRSVFVPLNDYTATVIGMVKDNKPFNTLLSADILYVGKPSTGAPAYSPANNAHRFGYGADGSHAVIRYRYPSRGDCWHIYNSRCC